MTIHSTHPFADADPDPARRFRGRVGGVVTLWTSGAADERAGLAVTSLMIALGPEPSALALVDPDSELLEVLRETGRAVVQPLAWGDRQLAEAFAGTAPAPGGPFRQATFTPTGDGPRLARAGALPPRSTSPRQRETIRRAEREPVHQNDGSIPSSSPMRRRKSS